MKIVAFFAVLFVTLALATQARATDSATAPEGTRIGNGKSADATAPNGGNGGGVDHGSSGKKVKFSGEAECAKCVLHQGNTCQTVIQTKHQGTTETYYVVQNDLAKELHKEVCESAHKVKVSGSVEDVDGKHKLTLEKFSVKDKK
jgi:hypothetical protein